jgi:hypothetical protein
MLSEAEGHPIPAVGGTIPYEKNRRLLAASWRSGARLACAPGMQFTQSLVRQRPASSHHWISFCQHGYARRTAAGLRSHCIWCSVRFIFCGRDQRDEAQHGRRNQYAVAGNDHHRRDLRCWNSRHSSQHSKRELRRFGLLQRRNQRQPDPDDYLAGTTSPKL